MDAALHAKTAELQSRFQQRSILNAEVREWLSDLGNREVANAKVIAVKPRAFERHFAAVTRIRNEIANLSAERTAILQARLSKSDMKAKAKHYVAKRALVGRPRMRADHETFELASSTDAWEASSKRSITDVLLWFHAETMIAPLHADIDAMPIVKGQLQLSRTERAKRLVSVTAAVLALERMKNRSSTGR